MKTEWRRPAVSVLMAVYNEQAYLAEALDSVLDQTFKDFELVIVDDASTDDTPRILDAYSQKDRRIRILRNRENLKLAGSLNRGLRICRAPWVARADGDDLYPNHRLEQQISFLRENDHVDVLSGWFERMNPMGDTLGFNRLPTSDRAIKTGLLWDSMICHAATLYRRLPILDKGGYNEQLPTAQDYDLWTRLGDDVVFANLPKFLMRYRIHNASATHRGCETRGKISDSISRSAQARFLNRPVSESEGKAFRKLMCAYEPLAPLETDNAVAMLSGVLDTEQRRKDPATYAWLRDRAITSLRKQIYYVCRRDWPSTRVLFMALFRIAPAACFSRFTMVQSARCVYGNLRRRRVLSS